MKLALLEEKGIIIAPLLLVAFIFFIPISPTIKSIFLCCTISALLLTPYYRQYILFAYNTSWGLSAIVFFLYIVMASLWSPAPYAMQWAVIIKYGKLVYLPILAVGFIKPNIRHASINVYLAAVLITCILSILKSRGILGSSDPGEVFYNHIITGFMVALGCYLAAFFAFQTIGWTRSVYLFLALITSYQVLFINTGRTGYIIYFVLMILLLLQKLNFRKAVFSVLLLCGVMVLVYNQSTTMQVGVHALLYDVRFMNQSQQNTSLGYRIQFHHYAQSLFEEHPILGVGTGGFKYRFSQDKPIPAWGNMLTDPHGQYWMTLSEQGLIGLLLLFVFLGCLFVTSFKLNETRPILLGILISFCLGSLSDSILCYSTEGYLLIVLSAMCFGELIEQCLLKNKSER